MYTLMHEVEVRRNLKQRKSGGNDDGKEERRKKNWARQKSINNLERSGQRDCDDADEGRDRARTRDGEGDSG